MLIGEKKIKQFKEVLSFVINEGWFPFGLGGDIRVVYDCGKVVFWVNGKYGHTYSLREVLSYESGFWQFVCEKRLQKKYEDYRDYFEDSFGFRVMPVDSDGSYFLIKCATIRDDMKLIEFVLSAI